MYNNSDCGCNKTKEKKCVCIEGLVSVTGHPDSMALPVEVEQCPAAWETSAIVNLQAGLAAQILGVNSNRQHTTIDNRGSSVVMIYPKNPTNSTSLAGYKLNPGAMLTLYCNYTGVVWAFSSESAEIAINSFVGE